LIIIYKAYNSINWKVYSRDGETKVGKISKQWSGLLREAYTDTDNFGINFPMDLDVKMKAVMLGACFLIVIIKKNYSTIIEAYIFFYIYP